MHESGHAETVLATFQGSLARFRRRSTHAPNLTDEVGTAKEGYLHQFGTAVLFWCGKSSTESVESLSNVCRT